MSRNAQCGLVHSRGRHHQVAESSVLDGSVFPTSIGASAPLLICGATAQNAAALGKDLRS